MTDLIEPLEDQALRSAQLYLNFGPAPLTELTRVLAEHLDSPPPAVRAALLALVRSGVLNLAGSTVSLPAGSERRDTKEHQQ
jgi:hypothetical protein